MLDSLCCCSVAIYLLVWHVLQDISWLAVQFPADCLKRGEPDRPHLACFEVRHVDAADSNSFRKVCDSYPSLCSEFVYVKLNRNIVAFLCADLSRQC